MKAIARIAKLKGGSLSASEQHTSRDRETPNANPTQPNQRLVDVSQELTLAQQIRQRIGDQRIRKDAVLCVELLLSVSPEYFRSSEPSRAGYWEAEKLEQFQWTVQQWLSETYRDRVLRAELHLDEVTPHIHAYVIPLDEQGKLNCKKMFGGREKLRQFQDSYAKALEPLGVERGIRRSRATHTAIQEYYAAVMQEPNLSLDAETIQHQLNDRRRTLKERDELERTARALERENMKLRSQLQHHHRSLEYYRSKSAQLRDLPIESVAYELGLNVDLKRPHVWHSQDCEIHISDRKFYDWQAMKGGGGAIDLVMHVRQCDFRKAVLWLRDRFGESAALQTIANQAQDIFQAEPTPQFVLPVAEEQYWRQVRKYLTQTLKFPAPLIDRLHEQKLVYANADQQVVFVHRDLENGSAGASLSKAIGATTYSLETQAYDNQRSGSRNGFYLQAGKDLSAASSRLVLVDSPLEALSKFVLDYPQQTKTLYFALNDAVDLPIADLHQFAEVVVACFQPDRRSIISERLASRARAVAQQEPKTNSWHHDLVDGVLFVEARAFGTSRSQIEESQVRKDSALEMDE